MADQPPGGGPEPPSSAIRGRVRLGRIVPYATGALVALVAVLLWSALIPATPPLTQHDIDDTVAKALASVTPAPAFSEQVYAAVRPSLVLIETKQPKPKGATGSDNGLGSGVVVTTAGDILTSLHVVADATEINVTFADGTRSGAQVTAREPEHDIAVLRATEPPTEIVPATLGDPRAVHEGSEAYTLGNPLGLVGSMSAGVISGLDRSFKIPNSQQVLTGLIQIDAAVNPGNSGGPLTDRDGHVIGIVAALVNPTEDDVFIGIGLAVPIDVAGGAAGLPPY